MGFYLRKSFRAGPIRFNLSKSGVGASFGVTGARLGVSSRGRAYVHGGRGGLYYRKSLGTGGGGRAGGGGADGGRAGDEPTGGGRAPAARLAAPGPVELTEDTGVTYGALRRQEQAPEAIAEPVRSAPPTYGWLALGAVAAGLLLPSPFPAVVAALVFAGLVALGARRGKRRAAGDAYGGLLDARVAAADPITDDERSAIDAARRDPALTPADARYFEERAYLGLLEDAAANGASDPRALERLAEVDGLVGLDPAFRRRGRLDAYSRAHVEAVSDHDLTEAEERALDRVRAAFELTDEELADELSLLERLRELRAIRDGDLPVVDATVKLSSREVCHLESEGRLLKRRLLRSFSRDGQRYKVRGYVIDKEGTLVVTSRRVALVHQGVTSFPIGKIIDVEVDHDRQLLILTRDNVATPTCLTTPDALRAGAIVAALTEER